MKKQRISVLVILTAIFAAFTLGLFLGRNQNRNAVIVSVPISMQTDPKETTLPVPETVPETEAAITFPIDINTADAEEFMALPGIGEVLAERIVTYREENGSFTAVEGLLNVEGIGEKRIEDILELITIGG